VIVEVTSDVNAATSNAKETLAVSIDHLRVLGDISQAIRRF
jgi:hypothetical protein